MPAPPTPSGPVAVASVGVARVLPPGPLTAMSASPNLATCWYRVTGGSAAPILELAPAPAAQVSVVAQRVVRHREH